MVLTNAIAEGYPCDFFDRGAYIYINTGGSEVIEKLIKGNFCRLLYHYQIIYLNKYEHSSYIFKSRV